MNIKYILLDPTGNITLLVMTPVPHADQSSLASRLMARVPCEQVGFLESPADPICRARLQMMGGEFCGNGSMSTALVCALDDGIPLPCDIPLEVSGAEGIVNCAIARDSYGFTGTVNMPRVTSVEEKAGYTCVHMDGIAHFITEEPLPEADAIPLLRSLMLRTDEGAVGLLQWTDGFLKPLVGVRATDSFVWEHGCGSGSAAVGAYEALRKGENTVTRVAQPGGTITVRTETDGRSILSTTITGRVRVLVRGEIDL